MNTHGLGLQSFFFLYYYYYYSHIFPGFRAQQPFFQTNFDLVMTSLLGY